MIERIGDWRDSAREAERDGDQLVRMRAGDLVELARSRVVRLQKGAIQAEQARSMRVAPAGPTGPAAEPPRRPSKDRVAERQPDDGAARREQASRDAEHRAKTEAAPAEAEKAEAAARLAEAEAARVEAQTPLLCEQAEAARRVTVAPAAAAPRAKSPAQKGPAITKPAVNAGASTTTNTPSRSTAAHTPPEPRKQPAGPREDDGGYTEGDRLALASVGHWPPTPPAHRGAFWTKHDDWPRHWALTGGDLGRFRGEVNLTRAVFAAQLGVPSAVVKDAELSPRERVGLALQIALRRAMELAAAERRRRREERVAAAAKPETAVAAEVATVTPVAPPNAAAPEAPPSAAVAITGTDLARLRAERRLSQREMADLLGVEQGTVSKGEAKAGAALGPALQEAMARLGAGGGAGGAPPMPE